MKTTALAATIAALLTLPLFAADQITGDAGTPRQDLVFAGHEVGSLKFNDTLGCSHRS